MMDAVKIIECPRDAWQGLKRQIPTLQKVEYLRRLVDAGFRHIDAVSFVSPKVVPQMADSEAVVEQLGPLEGVEIIGIVVNEKGAERAIATGAVSTLGYPYSISETFLRRNQNQSLAENAAVLERIRDCADEAGIGVVAYISMAFGNPYGDMWSEEKVAQAARAITGTGVNSLSLADTTGAAESDLIHRVLSAVLRGGREFEVGVHLHSTPAGARAKVLAAYDAGCRRFDSAIGGLGGCPFAQDKLVGNVPTEEVLGALQERGLTLPVDGRISKVLAMNAAISEEFSAHETLSDQT
ncbi:MAG: hydroxymethylglutaryl-CoA lyase [Verrucomicrobia bacterium]|nr:MAG: hydroxymethylglutaryl-CoA lyase [Verrucomicrobiota bacterium]